MRVRFLTFFAAIFVASPASADRSCAELNKFYENTRNVSRYQVIATFILPGEITSRSLAELRYNGKDLFVRGADGNWWLRYREPMVVDLDYPTFSDCVRQPDEIENGHKIISFKGDWQRGPRRSTFGFRISADTGRAIEVKREFTLVGKGYPTDVKGAIMIEKFTYDRSVPNPTAYR